MNIKKILVTIGITIFSYSALAGLTQPASVEIDFEGRFAAGDMLSARGSDNDFEFIGCGSRKIAVSETEIFSFGFCQAGNAEGEGGSITCTTQNAEMLSAIDAISDFSYITFRWDENLECTRMGTSTQSFYLPKTKANKE